MRLPNGSHTLGLVIGAQRVNHLPACALASGPTGGDSSAQSNGLGNVRVLTRGLKGRDTLVAFAVETKEARNR